MIAGHTLPSNLNGINANEALIALGSLAKAALCLPKEQLRRICGSIALAIGRGGKTIAAKLFGVSKEFVRKGLREAATGLAEPSNAHKSGRKAYTELNPGLEEAIREIMQGKTQADPRLADSREYTETDCPWVRERLLERFPEKLVPKKSALSSLLGKMGYRLKKVAKTEPKKKIPETDLIFENVERKTSEYEKNSSAMLISIDVKNKTAIGAFSKGGKSRLGAKAADHDYCDHFLYPIGLLDIKSKVVRFAFSQGKPTAGQIWDLIESYYIESFLAGNKYKALGIKADNGGSNQSWEFRLRALEFAAKYKIVVEFIYLPPYHSKYNDVEHVFGTLQKHWGGLVLDTEEMTRLAATTMTYKGKNPTAWIWKASENEARDKRSENIWKETVLRTAGIEKWAVRIEPEPAAKAMAAIRAPSARSQSRGRKKKAGIAA